MQEILINRRARDRHATDIRAQYFIKSRSVRFEDCTIVNLSRTGAAVRFGSLDQLEAGTEIDLEIIVPANFEQVTLKSVVVWFDAAQSLCGVKFIRLMDEVPFGRLISMR